MRRSIGIWITMLALAVTTWSTASVRSETTQTVPPTALEQCCTTSSYGRGGPRSLTLTSRVALTLSSYLKDPAAAYHKPPLAFFQQVARTTGVDFTINPLASDLNPVASRLRVASLPTDRGDLAPEALADLRQRFADLSNEQFGAGLPKGIDGLLDLVYANDQEVIASARRFGPDGRMAIAFVFAKPAKGQNVDLPLRKAVLEGFGYDADGRALDDSIFTRGGPLDLTEKDLQAMRQLYSRPGP